MSGLGKGYGRDAALWCRVVQWWWGRLIVAVHRVGTVLSHLLVADISIRGNRCPKPWMLTYLYLARRSGKAKLPAAHTGAIARACPHQTLSSSLLPVSPLASLVGFVVAFGQRS